jgi:hypothetical protein
MKLNYLTEASGKKHEFDKYIIDGKFEGIEDFTVDEMNDIELTMTAHRSTLNLDNSNLKSLKGLPKSISQLDHANITADKNELTDLHGLEQFDNLNLVTAGYNPLTSLKGLPQKVKTLFIYHLTTTLEDLSDLKNTKIKVLNIAGTNIKSFDYFPIIEHLSCTVTNDEYSLRLMQLHEFCHEHRFFSKIDLQDPEYTGNKRYEALTNSLMDLSDPFDFQDWCINNGWEELL